MTVSRSQLIDGDVEGASRQDAAPASVAVHAPVAVTPVPPVAVLTAGLPHL